MVLKSYIFIAWSLTNAPLLPFKVNRSSNMLVTANIDSEWYQSLVTVSSRMMKCGKTCRHMHISDCVLVCTLAGSNNLVDPAAQVGHTGVHSRGAHIAVRSAPGHNTHKGPHSTVLTDQRATRVTLKWDTCFLVTFKSMHHTWYCFIVVQSTDLVFRLYYRMWANLPLVSN